MSNQVFHYSNTGISSGQRFYLKDEVSGIFLNKLNINSDSNIIANNLVYNTGNQTIDGPKTFNNIINFYSGVAFLRDAGVVADADIDLLNRFPLNTRVSIGTDTGILGQSINTLNAEREIKIWETGGAVTAVGYGPYIRIGRSGVLISEKTESKVGIGTLFPTEKVHISGGNLKVEGNAIANNLVYNTGDQTISGIKIFGTNNNYSGAHVVIAGGSGNLASGNFSTIGGGFRNCATAFGATIGGGYRNLATGACSTVGGGRYNCATANYATVGGGRSNRATGAYSTVGGGYKNCATEYASTIGGGAFNCAAANYATVGGGAVNFALGICSTIGGGAFNCADRDAANSTIGGGRNNCATGAYSTVGGGGSNCTLGYASTIGGGAFNYAEAANSTIGGGGVNCAVGINSTIGGGRFNYAFSINSTIGGGIFNCASVQAYSATIGGGCNNRVCESCATIGGGYKNSALATFSTIGGGRVNCASGEYSTIGGGAFNCALGCLSTLGGGSVNCTTGVYSTVGGGASNRAFGYASTIGGGGSNFAIANFTTIGGGRYNCASGYASTIGGGDRNSAFGDYSYIIGGRCSTVSALHSGAAVLGDGQNRSHNSFSAHALTLDFDSGVYFAKPFIYGDLNILSGHLKVNNTGVLLSGQNIFTIALTHTSSTPQVGFNYFGMNDMGYSQASLGSRRRIPIAETCQIRKTSWSHVVGTIGAPANLYSSGYLINTSSNPPQTGIIFTGIDSSNDTNPAHYITNFSTPINVISGDLIVAALVVTGFVIAPLAARDSVILYCYN